MPRAADSFSHVPERPAIAIDNGSGWIKMGIAGEETPRARTAAESWEVYQDDRPYELPDGTCIFLGNARFRCPEALFQPGLIGKPAVGVHDAACRHDGARKRYEDGTYPT